MREHSYVELCGAHVAISPVMVRSSNEEAIQAEMSQMLGAMHAAQVRTMLMLLLSLLLLPLLSLLLLLLLSLLPLPLLMHAAAGFG